MNSLKRGVYSIIQAGSKYLPAGRRGARTRALSHANGQRLH
jgi:hypothetical protein